MTVQVGIVNLLLETHGGVRRQGGATWYLLLFHWPWSLVFDGSLAYLSSCSPFYQIDFAAMFVPEIWNANSYFPFRSPPLAAITFRDLVLYTTNEKWQVPIWFWIITLLINYCTSSPDFSAFHIGSKFERSKGFLQQQGVHLCFQGLMLLYFFQKINIHFYCYPSIAN